MLTDTRRSVHCGWRHSLGTGYAELCKNGSGSRGAEGMSLPAPSPGQTGNQLLQVTALDFLAMMGCNLEPK